MALNPGKAERAIRKKIAAPLGVSVEQAASLIRRVVDEHMASAIKREVHMRGYKPEEFVLFAFGGAGPTHVSGFRGDVPKAVVFPASPVSLPAAYASLPLLKRPDGSPPPYQANRLWWQY